MVNRVLLGNWNNKYVLRVSRPGHDVMNNLSVSQLAFDSEWGSTFQVLTAGVTSVQANVEKIVYYGQTLSYIPIVFIWNYKAINEMEGFPVQVFHHVYNNRFVLPSLVGYQASQVGYVVIATSS